MGKRWVRFCSWCYTTFRNMLIVSGMLLLFLQFGCTNEDDRSWEILKKDISFASVSQYLQSHPNGAHLAEIAQKGQQTCITNKDTSQICFILKEYDAYQKSVFPEHEGHGAVVLDIVPIEGKIHAQLDMGSVLERTKNGMNPGLLAFRFIRLNDAEYKVRNLNSVGGVTLTKQMFDGETTIGTTRVGYGFSSVSVENQDGFLIDGTGKSNISVVLILRSKYEDINGLSVFGVPCKTSH